jgi:50S ribosomal protein L16 3-hydroxylase
LIKFPDAITPQSFLRDYWQKSALLMPQAMPAELPEIDADELAWLATQDDVESRLVFRRQSGARDTYELEHGPFDEQRLRDLPDENWTLLVNDVDKHLPALRAWIAALNFIPDWRVDDLMISFAAPGGGVGPHRDNYDVFLCQGSGTRQWRVSSDPVEADPAASEDLALLQPFASEVLTCRHGDVLYLPPGIAHWGVADDQCMTYSIGMRAPRMSDLLSSWVGTAQDPFYTDADLATNEAAAGYISADALRRARTLLQQAASMPDAELGALLGQCVTRTKDWLRPDGSDAPLQTAQALELHGMARIAWDQERIYLNGASRRLSAEQRELAARLCRNRHLDCSEIPEWLQNVELRALLEWLQSEGAFADPADLTK